MRSSFLPEPTDQALICVKKWHIDACDGNRCAAMLLSFFIYWHGIKKAIKEKNERANAIAERHGDQPTQDVTLLQFHNEQELQDGLLGFYSRDSIREGIKLLESKGFVSLHKNPNPRYSFDKTRYLLISEKALINWLKNDHRSTESRASMSKNRERSSEKQPLSLENRGTRTETTSEITSEIKEQLHVESAQTADSLSSLAAGDAVVLKAEKIKPESGEKEEEQKPTGKAQSQQQLLLAAVATVCRLNMKLRKGGWPRLAKEVQRFSQAGVTPDQIGKFGRYWYSEDFRGQKDQPPTIGQIEDRFDTAMAWMEPLQEGEIKQETTAITIISRPGNGNGARPNKAEEQLSQVRSVFDKIRERAGIK